MKRIDLEEMDLDALWALHLEVARFLSAKIQAERELLEERLAQLRSQMNSRKERRYYPPAAPKYRNPDKPSETWAGRGKQPTWLQAKLRSGRQIEDFAIHRSQKRYA